MDGDWAGAIIGAIGLAGGIVGFVFARLADRRARRAEAAAEDALERAVKAAEAASEALKQSANASTESAAALKRANEIAEAQLPSTRPKWSVRRVRGSIYEAVNVSPGGGTAELALVEGAGEAAGLIRPEETEPRDVPAGRGLGFHVLRMGGQTPVVRISYRENGERISGDVEIR